MQASIHIFKTNINSLSQIRSIDSILSGNSEIKQWSIDIDDCDKVLRIESDRHEINDVIGSLTIHNVFCEAME
jgi:hypothetical protein